MQKAEQSYVFFRIPTLIYCKTHMGGKKKHFEAITSRAPNSASRIRVSVSPRAGDSAAVASVTEYFRSLSIMERMLLKRHACTDPSQIWRLLLNGPISHYAQFRTFMAEF